MTNNRVSPIGEFTRFSLLASMTALMQISPALIPGPGHVLSAMGTLPVAVATFIRPRGGILCALVSAGLTFMIQPSEAPIIILCTGPLGIILGWSLYYGLSPLLSVMAAAPVLCSGMLFLTFGLGMPAFGPLLSGSRFFTVCVFFAGFSFIYTWAWLRFARSLIKRLLGTGFISTTQSGNGHQL